MHRRELNTEADVLAAARSLHGAGGLYELIARQLLDDHKELLVNTPPPPFPRRRHRLLLELDADSLDEVAAALDDLAALATIGPLPETGLDVGPIGVNCRVRYEDAGEGDGFDAAVDAWKLERAAWEASVLVAKPQAGS